MNRIQIWQCKDWCCEDRPFSDKWWMARTEDFTFYEQVPKWHTAMILADKHGKNPAA